MSEAINNEVKNGPSPKKTTATWVKIAIAIIGVVFLCCCVTLAFGALNGAPTEQIEIVSPTALEAEGTVSGETEEAVSPAISSTPELPTATSTPKPTVTPEPTLTPTPTETPVLGRIGVGTHIVGKDIDAGIYWGMAGYNLFDSCYWARLSDLSGELGAIIANDNAIGQYYIEVRDTDFALETGCELIQLEYVPTPEISDEIKPGTYIVGRDIKPGTYQGQAGDDILESCYWARLKDVSGDLDSIIANENAMGSYYVQVRESDFALTTGCPLTWVGE